MGNLHSIASMDTQNVGLEPRPIDSVGNAESTARDVSIRVVDEPTDDDFVHPDVTNANLLPKDVVGGVIDDEMDCVLPVSSTRELRFYIRSINPRKSFFNRGTGSRFFVVRASVIPFDCLRVPMPWSYEYVLKNPNWIDQDSMLSCVRYNTKDEKQTKVVLCFYVPQEMIATVDDIYKTVAIRDNDEVTIITNTIHPRLYFNACTVQTRPHRAAVPCYSSRPFSEFIAARCCIRAGRSVHVHNRSA